MPSADFACAGRSLPVFHAHSSLSLAAGGAGVRRSRRSVVDPKGRKLRIERAIGGSFQPVLTLSCPPPQAAAGTPDEA